MVYFWDACYRIHVAAYKDDKQNNCADAIETYGGLYFLAIAVMLTINKWIYFNMRLTVKIKMDQHEEQGTRSSSGIAW